MTDVPGPLALHPQTRIDFQSIFGPSEDMILLSCEFAPTTIDTHGVIISVLMTGFGLNDFGEATFVCWRGGLTSDEDYVRVSAPIGSSYRTTVQFAGNWFSTILTFIDPDPPAGGTYLFGTLGAGTDIGGGFVSATTSLLEF